MPRVSEPAARGKGTPASSDPPSTLRPGEPPARPSAIARLAMRSEALDALAEARRHLEDLLTVAIDQTNPDPLHTREGARADIVHGAVDVMLRLREAEHAVEELAAG